MRDLYSDDYESVAVGDADRLIPEGVKRLAGAAIFLGLVGALGLWSYRLGTRDAAEVPIIRAMEGPSRVEPENPGGLQAAHQGLEVNAVLAGRPAPMPRDAAPAVPPPDALATEDAPQGELVLATPAVLAERVLGEDGVLPTPPPEEAAASEDGLGLAAPDADAEVAAAGPAIAGPRPRSRPANLRAAAAKTTAVASVNPAAAVATPAAAPAETPPNKVAAAAPANEVSGVRAGARLVQLGAFDSEEITRQAWDQLVARNGDLLGSKSLYVERATSNARVFYRLRVAGFENADQTRQICEALRSRGVACIPVTLQ
jgi:cell division septation protein DedD